MFTATFMRNLIDAARDRNHDLPLDTGISKRLLSHNNEIFISHIAGIFD